MTESKNEDPDIKLANCLGVQVEVVKQAHFQAVGQEVVKESQKIPILFQRTGFEERLARNLGLSVDRLRILSEEDPPSVVSAKVFESPRPILSRLIKRGV